jgi:GntR family transcriptional regulator
MVDPMDPTPLYEQVANEIERRIQAGVLAAGQLIPSELSMQQEFGVARGTARKAVEVLRERGLVVTIPRRGTYVRTI